MSNPDVVEADLRAMREDISEIKEAMTKVATALERLARLEERHATVAAALDRAFSAISKLGTRVTALELAQPVQKLMNGWVEKGVLAVAGGAITFVIMKVVS